MGDTRGRKPSQEVVRSQEAGLIYTGNPFGFTSVGIKVTPLSRVPPRNVGVTMLRSEVGVGDRSLRRRRAAIEEEYKEVPNNLNRPDQDKRW